MPIFLLDLTRLLERLHHAVPRGIDRVTLEYALHFEARGEQARFCAFVSGEWLLLPRGLVSNILIELSSRWFRPASPLKRCAGWAFARGLRRPRVREAVLRRVARRMSSPVLPEGPIVYLNVSHRSWMGLQGLRNALPDRELAIVAMVHDLMPITCGQFFPESLRDEFARGFSQLLEQADLLLVNSDDTRSAVLKRVRSSSERSLRIEHIPLAVRLAPVVSTAEASPSFVHIGPIDQRKNAQVLLQVWRLLSATGRRVPTLHLVGSRSNGLPREWQSLERYVKTHQALDDVGVGRLLQGSRALLFPSTAEGFGLPVVEALAHGVPAIASDLPSIRESVGGFAELLPPDDVGAWLRAVSDYSEANSPRREAQMARLKGYRAPSWRDHFAHLDRVVLESLHVSSILYPESPTTCGVTTRSMTKSSK